MDADRPGQADPASPDQGSEFARSLTAVSQLSPDLDLERLLTIVAEASVIAIPGADGAGLTLLEAGQADIIVKSAPFVGQVDDIQYAIEEGPCISAAAQGTTMRSGSLGGDRRWPRFGPRAGRMGVHSVLSLPLITPSGVVGAMNVYAHSRNAFDQRSADLGEFFAVPAAIAVHNAQILARTARLAAKLQRALDNRGVIDQAIGIVRSRSGGSAEDAFARLSRMSQAEHKKLNLVATNLVDEAARRADLRHND